MREGSRFGGLLPSPEWREFLHWPLYATLAFALVAVVLAYQWPQGTHLNLDIGAHGDGAYLGSFHKVEFTPGTPNQRSYRWSTGKSYITVPGVARNVPLRLTLEIAGRPPTAPPDVLTLTANDQKVGTLELAAPFSSYTVDIPATANNRDDLQLVLRIKSFSPPGDARKLGVVVDRLEIGQQGQAGGLGVARPPTYPVVWLVLSVLLAFLAMRHLGISRRISVLGSMFLGGLAAVAVSVWRYDLTLVVVQIGVVMVCVYLLALVMPPVVLWFMRRLRVPVHPPDLRWLMVIYLLAFGTKTVGLMHPRFEVIDHIFRVHQVRELAADPAAFWRKYQNISTAEKDYVPKEGELSYTLGQWDLNIPFPYPPSSYFVMLPLTWIWGSGYDDELLITMNATLVALSGTAVFALYAIARRSFGSGRAGVLAGAITGLAPITYLHFSDGGYPFVWAGWISLVYIMAAICLADRAHKPAPFIVLSVLSALALLSHTAIAGFAVVFAVLGVVVSRLLKGSKEAQTKEGTYSLVPLFLSFLAGAALSMIYYGGYVWPIVSVAVPTILQKGLRGGVGLDQQLVGSKLLTGFWPQIEAHFVTWPALLALAGAIVLGSNVLRTRRKDVVGQADTGWLAPAVLLAAWAGTFLVFSVIDLRVNLLQRHMDFGLPLLALLGGYALARLQLLTRVRPALALATLLVGYLFIVGLDRWVARVLDYKLVPGSG